MPLDFYERCRDPLRRHQAQAVGDMEAQAQDVGEFDHEGAIAAYQKLIIELPPLNRQLLLYILDLLAVFASKSEQNRMTSANLAAIFQPGLLSHPSHDMSPSEYRLSQDVLIFLIENQDSFLVGMSGTAADEKTVKEVQSGVQRQPNTPNRASQAGLGRSASNASAGADSLRRPGARRNLSISSKNSKGSGNVPSPGSPAPGSPLVNANSGTGVYRSNTVPSKRSPHVSASRFSKANGEQETLNASTTSPGNGLTASARSPSPASNLPPLAEPGTPAAGTAQISTPESKPRDVSKDLSSSEGLSLRAPEHGVTTTITTGTPNKDRKSFFSKSPTSDTERKDGRQQPKKLKKKNRAQTTSNSASAHSSTHSLHVPPEVPAGRFPHSPLVGPGTGSQANHDPTSQVPPAILNTDASPTTEQPPQLGDIEKMSAFHLSHHSASPSGSPALKPTKSPAPSIHSKASVAEDSEADHVDDGIVKEGKKRHSRWKLSTSSKSHQEPRSGSQTGSRLGSMAVAEKSETSLASTGKPKKSETFDSQHTNAGTEASTAVGTNVSSNESTPSKDKDVGKEADDKERKGPIGWLKAKVAHAKEEREERKADKGAEKERTKSPPTVANENATSKNSLHALTTQEGSPAVSPETTGEKDPDQSITTEGEHKE